MFVLVNGLKSGLKCKCQVWQPGEVLFIEECFYFMADFELQKFVIDSGLYKRYAKARRISYLQELGEDLHGENLQGFERWLAENHNENWFHIVQVCERVSNTSYQRIKRLKERIKALTSQGECLFLTLTFNDDTLTSTSEKARRSLVHHYLKSFSSDFIANVDYGKENEREHYHAVILASKVDYTLWHSFGAIRGEKVHLRGNTEAKVARYIDKLSLHALKDTTYRNRLLYSHSA